MSVVELPLDGSCTWVRGVGHDVCELLVEGTCYLSIEGEDGVAELYRLVGWGGGLVAFLPLRDLMMEKNCDALFLWEVASTLSIQIFLFVPSMSLWILFSSKMHGSE